MPRTSKKTPQTPEGNKKTKFTVIANAYKTKDNKKFIFSFDNRTFMLSKATVNDWRYSSFSGEYVIKEITEVKAANDKAL